MFCDTKCYGKWYRELQKKEIPCSYCGKIVSGRKYCDSVCRNNYYSMYSKNHKLLTRMELYFAIEALSYFNEKYYQSYKEKLQDKIEEQRKGYLDCEYNYDISISISDINSDRCDLDNMVKAVIDSLKGIIIDDDKRIKKISATLSENQQFNTIYIIIKAIK